MRVVVTASRHIRNGAPIREELDVAMGQGMTKMAQGGARGGDRHALMWSVEMGFPHKTYKVDTAIDGPWPAAGVRRNDRMLDDFKPDLVLAFPQPSSKGTWRCIESAVARGIRVIIVPLETGA